MLWYLNTFVYIIYFGIILLCVTVLELDIDRFLFL